jgi:SnoaL-like domain
MARSGDSRDSALQDLLDKEALRDIALRYSRAIDRMDLDLLKTVYHPDATDDHGVWFNGSASQFIAQLPEINARLEALHHSITNSFYRIDGDRADGELYFDAYQRTKPPESLHILVRGRYLDNYERRGGVWRIAHRRLVWDSMETTPVSAADAKQFSAMGRIGSFEDDRSYEALRLFPRGH